MTRRRHVTAGAAVAASAVLVATALTGCAAADTTPDLAQIVASWPDAFQVSGTKAEPLYTELIHVSREGDVFDLRIDALGQGDAALGTQISQVRVHADGTVEWLRDCADCAEGREVRGFLATAAIVGLAREGRLPATGTAREVHGTAVICVDDAALHPDAEPSSVTLDPCFDRATGAVVAHWSPDSGAFVGATLAAGFTVTTGAP